MFIKHKLKTISRGPSRDNPKYFRYNLKISWYGQMNDVKLFDITFIKFLNEVR